MKTDNFQAIKNQSEALGHTLSDAQIRKIEQNHGRLVKASQMIGNTSLLDRAINHYVESLDFHLAP